MVERRAGRRLRSVKPAAPSAKPAAPEPSASEPPAGAVTIRRGVVEDAAAVAGVYVESRRHAGPLIPRMPHSDDDVRTWFASIVLVDHEVWVAEAAGRIVAIMVLRGESLDQLYVAPAAQRLGIGRKLLEHAKARRRRLRLFTFAANEPARAFYERHGFRAIAFGDGTTNEEAAPDVLYEWAR
ncbi:MAG: GNAT family N-acetyltransferase [Candidatus Rokubacteria bacterium]|nr:GNAT family N-acetyltransferase [Candidatus Rokubacteria bacterium]